MKLKITFLSLGFLALGLTQVQAQPTIMWHRSYDSGISDEGKSIVLSTTGGVYVAGLATFGPSRNLLSLKYDSSGTVVSNYTCTPELPGDLVKIQRSSGYSIYALVNVPLSSGDNTYSVMKYTPSGVLSWQFFAGDTANYRFTPVDIVLDNSGNAIIAGTFEEYVTHSKSGFFFKKITAAGSASWTRVYTGTGSCQAYDLTVDNAGNYYVCGTQSIGASSGDFVTIKYNSAGVQQWVRTFDGSAHLQDLGERVAVDNSGNVYVAGRVDFQPTNNRSDNVMVKYNASGVYQWRKKYGSTGYNSTKNILFDASSNPYIVAEALDLSIPSQPNHAYVAKLNTAGTLQWLKVHKTSNYIKETASASVTDGNGTIYVGGDIKDTASSFVSDMMVFKINSAGTVLWEQRGNGTAGENDLVRDMVLSGSNIFVAGAMGNATFDVRTTRIADKVVSCDVVFTQICYLNKTRCVNNASLSNYISRGATLGACVGLRTAFNDDNAPGSIYPNPSSTAFTYRWNKANHQPQKLEVIDMTGRVVDLKTTIENTVTFGNDLVQGIYFVKVYFADDAENEFFKIAKQE